MIFSIDDQTKREKTALLGEAGQSVTYGELCDAVLTFAGQLPPRGLGFLLCRNTPEAVIGYLGALESGNVPLLLDANLEESIFKALFLTYRPAWIWMPLERKRGEELPGRAVYGLDSYGLFQTGQQPCVLHPSLALLLATSGSTGSPKLVRLSRKNIESNAKAIAAYLQIQPFDRPVTSLPMQYTYGLSIIHSHLLMGSCILLTTKSVVQKEFWDFLEAQGATSLSGVPYTYRILDRLKFCQRKPGTLQVLTQAGGRLPENLQRKFGTWAQENGVRFYVMYGQTEATARMSYLPPQRCLDKIGSIGIPIPGGKFWIRDAEDFTKGSAGELGYEGENIAAAATGAALCKPGELVYEGENVTLGYALKQEDLRKGDEREGVLFTGDLACRDTEGYYYIVGRKSRFVKLFGMRVSLDACEKLLSKQYPNCESACIGEDDRLCIYVTDLEVAKECRSYLADILHVSPRVLHSYYLEELPKNDAGKVQYAALKVFEQEKEIG